MLFGTISKRDVELDRKKWLLGCAGPQAFCNSIAISELKEFEFLLSGFIQGNEVPPWRVKGLPGSYYWHLRSDPD